MQTAASLSIKDSLWEVAADKAEQAEIEEERQADIQKGKRPRKSTKGDALFEQIRQHSEFMNSLNEEEREAYQKAQEDLQVAEREALKDLKSVALEIIKAGYRELAVIFPILFENSL